MTPNIHRQPTCPFHEARICSGVAPTATGSAISQLITWASRMPITIVSWLIDTSLPRIAAGATSAMYRGERFDARPIADPAQQPVGHEDRERPREGRAQRRDREQHGRQDQQPLPPEPVAERPGEHRAPRQPISALLIAQPTWNGVVK